MSWRSLCSEAHNVVMLCAIRRNQNPLNNRVYIHSIIQVGQVQILGAFAPNSLALKLGEFFYDKVARDHPFLSIDNIPPSFSHPRLYLLAFQTAMHFFLLFWFKLVCVKMLWNGQCWLYKAGCRNVQLPIAMAISLSPCKVSLYFISATLTKCLFTTSRGK